NLYHVEITSGIRFQRSLAKRVPKKELDHSKIRDVLSENNSYNNVKCTSDDLSEYAQLKKKGLNDLEIYKEQFKHKYDKRKGFKRLDCYCEKKYLILLIQYVFNSIDWNNISYISLG
ncbi:CYIR protein, partial [Plasmodium cynomolgi strain B]